MTTKINSSRRNADAVRPSESLWIWTRGVVEPTRLFAPAEDETALDDPRTGIGPRSAFRLIWDIVKAVIVIATAIVVILVITIPLSFVDYFLNAGLVNSAIQLVLSRIAKYLGMRTTSGLQNLIDPRRPVLFLRADTDDGIRVEKDSEYRQPDWRDPLGMNWTVPFEEVFATTVSRFGPLVSLRLPNERPGAFGFRRYSVGHDVWQQQILYWINRSSLIALLLPPTTKLEDSRYGIAWEIATIAKMNAAHKLIVLHPPLTRTENASRWKRFCQLLKELGIQEVQEELPDPTPILSSFSKDWQCTHEVRTTKGALPSQYVKAIRKVVSDENETRWRTYQAGIVGILFASIAGSVAAFGWSLSLWTTGTFIAVVCVAAAIGGLIGFVGRLW